MLLPIVAAFKNRQRSIEMRTPPPLLYLAISACHRHVVELLLDHGADLKRRDNHNDKALELPVWAMALFSIIVPGKEELTVTTS